MTINEHIAHIQTLFNSGLASDDKKLSDMHIYHLLKLVRSRLLYEKQNKMYKISDFSFQYIPCLKLEEGFLNDCPCVPQDCPVLVSKPLPKPLNWRNGYMLKVTTLDGVTIPEMSLAKYKYQKYRKTQLSKYGWFIHDGRLIVVGDLRLCLVSIKGLFEDPTELEGISICDSEGNETPAKCYDVTTDEFPIDTELVDTMYKLVTDQLGLAYQLPQDNENNAKSVETAQGKE
jgi:hypothetical protein